MKIKYKFVNGDVVEIEVPTEIGAFITTSRREEANANRRERYHSAYSLDALKYEPLELSGGEDPESYWLRRERDAELYAALETLTRIQLRRFLLYANDYTFSEIALLEGVRYKQAKRSVEQAQRALRKILKSY